jgi:hypothetical protein
MKLSEAVSLYIQLRDKKAQLKADYELLVAPVQQKMDALEAKLLEVFNQTGMDSVKTEHGTAYSTVRVTATVADRSAFMDFVKTNDEWDLLEVRAAKAAVEQFREMNDNQLPPGLNLREERVVNIRRTA